MKLTHAPNQARNSLRAIRATITPGAAGELHRSLGWRVITLEGWSRPDQRAWFTHLLNKTLEVRRIVEVGFNAGHSSLVFLQARTNISVVSFDLGTHGYIHSAKTFIDSRFPGRHTLILGDSTVTVPLYQQKHPEASFDLAFIDGGHDYEIASADVRNVLPLIHPAGLVVMDDLCPWKPWGAGPVRAWSEAKQEGLIREVALVQDGRDVESVQQKSGTAAWALGVKR